MGYDLAMKGVVLGLVISIGAAVAGVPARKMVPAIYVLGDSTLDVGNNNHLQGKDVPRANKPLYGVDFPGGKPTGRFSNGYNIADFIGKALGLEKSPKAYLSLKACNRVMPSALRGVSYASAGAGILDSTNAGNNIPLSKQVRYLALTKKEMEAKVGTRAVRALLGRSFFLLGAGSDDLFAFVTAQQRQNKSTTQSDVAALVTNLISTYSATITDLYKMGARKFGVINVGPVGCVPRVRVLNATGACSDGLNQLAVGFDGALKSLLAGLATRLPGFAYSLADSYALRQLTFADPMASGFVSADSACCGGGRLGAQAACLPNSTVCAHRDRYIFWDSVHSTQRAAQLGAQAFYDGPAQLTTPLNFKQLACNN